MMSKSRRKNLLLGLVMGLVLMLLSYARIVGDSQSMAFREEVLDTIFAGAIWGTQLMWNLIWFGVALTALHLVFGAASWGLGTLSAGLSPKPDQQKNERQHVVLWFALLTLGILAFNSAEFSRSSLGSPYARIMTNPIAGLALGKWIAGVIGLSALAVLATALAKALRSGWRPYRNPRRFAVGAVAMLLLVVAAGGASVNYSHNDALANERGSDRHRFTAHRHRRQAGAAGVAPHMREFLEGLGVVHGHHDAAGAHLPLGDVHSHGPPATQDRRVHEPAAA